MHALYHTLADLYLQSLRTTRKSHLILLSCELAVISRALSVAAVELSPVASALSVPGPELACADLSVTREDVKSNPL